MLFQNKYQVRVTTVGVKFTVPAAMAVVLGLMAVQAQGAVLKPDFHAPLQAQVLPHDGDFDGDGRRDSLYLVNEADSSRIAVHVRLNKVSGSEDLRVTSFDQDSAKDAGLHVAAAGWYHPDCGNFATDCGGAIHTNSDGLLLSLSSGGTVLVHWQDGRFEQDFVRSDEAAMARVAAALYAENR